MLYTIPFSSRYIYMKIDSFKNNSLARYKQNKWTIDVYSRAHYFAHKECVWKLCEWIALGIETLKHFETQKKEIPGISFKFFLIFFTKRCKSINVAQYILHLDGYDWLCSVCVSFVCAFSFVLFKPSQFYFFHFFFINFFFLFPFCISIVIIFVGLMDLRTSY